MARASEGGGGEPPRRRFHVIDYEERLGGRFDVGVLLAGLGVVVIVRTTPISIMWSLRC